MKRFLLYILLMSVFAINADAMSFWVGQTKRLEVMNGALNARWSTNGGYLSLSGAGNYQDVTITKYFEGKVTVTCKYEYRIGSTKQQGKTEWTIESLDNPIYINPTKMTLNVGEKGQLSYTHEKPNEYVKYSKAYFSVAPQYSGIVTVTEDGKVTAKAPGTALVNVYSKITGGAPYCTITVKEAKATKISLQETIDMFEGQVYSVSPTITPSGAIAKLTWSSDNESVVKVSSDGVMTALKDGTANITVKTDNGLSAKSKIVVYKGPDQIKLIPGTITLYVGYGYKINPILVPENSKTAISIKPSDTSIAMLTDSYFISGVKPGKTTVVVRSSNGKETTCTINVIDTKPEYQGNAIKEKTNSLDILMKKALNNTAY